MKYDAKYKHEVFKTKFSKLELLICLILLSLFKNIYTNNVTILNSAIKIKISNRTSENHHLILLNSKKNMSLMPVKMTDKVDLDIKKLDKKIESLTKMIENYEKFSNSTKQKKNLSTIIGSKFRKNLNNKNSSIKFRTNKVIYS